MKRRDFIKMIEADGWVFKRHGKHDTYVLGDQSFHVPNHKEIKPGIEAQYKKRMKELNGE